MALANVATTNTFDEWRIRTNQIIYKLDEVEGNTSNSLANNNANVAATIIQLQANVANTINYANTAFLAITGGTLTGNVAFSGSDLILDLL
jgi:hypothetical protein